MLTDWSENTTKEKNAHPFKLSPRIRTWSTSSTDTFGASSFEHLKENTQRALCKQQGQPFPDVYDGANQWYTTVEHLSRKVSSQRHEIWSLQKKLRAEVENSRVQEKAIQLDRREHKEIISALNLKIQLLEKQLRRALLNNTNYEDGNMEKQIRDPSEASEAPTNARTSSTQSDHPQASQLARSPDEPVVPKPQDVQLEMVKLSEENRVLREILLTKRIDSNLSQTPSSAPAAQSSPVQNASTPQAPPFMECRVQSSLQNSPRDSPASPKKSSLSPPAPRNTRSETESLEGELRRLLLANSELTGRLKAQSEEMAQQKSNFQYLQTLMERNLERAASLDNSGGRPSISMSNRSSSPMNMYSKPSPHSPPRDVPELSIDTSSTQSESETLRSVSSLNQGTSTPLAYGQHVHNQYAPEPYANYPQTNPHRSTPTNARPIRSPTTSISSSKLSTTKASPLPREFKKSEDPNGQRLMDFLKRLRNKEISENELKHYEEIYNSLPQIVAERPQLAIETSQLANQLERNVPRKHVGLLKDIHYELQEVA